MAYWLGRTCSLIQAISRVTRNYEGQRFAGGLYGFQKDKKHALGRYNQSTIDDFEDIDKARILEKIKSSYNLCSRVHVFSVDQVDEIHFYFAVKSIVVILTKGEYG